MKSGRRSPSTTELEKLTHLFNQGLHTEAEIRSKSLTERFPKHGFAWKVLGVIYQEQKRYVDSLQATQQAIALLPDDAATYNNLGTTFLRLERFQEAEANFRKALVIAPDYPKALVNLGASLRFNRKLRESEDCCRRALQVAPLYVNGHIALGNALELQNRLPEAQASYQEALAISPNMASLHTDLLHLLSLDVLVEPRQLHAAHLAFGEQFEAPLRASWQAHNNVKDPERCLQIGFVSSDLYDHALANFLEPAFKFLSKKKALSLHVYYTRSNKDAVTERMRSCFAYWDDVADLSDDALANRVRADGIDILIDLSGHTVHNRLGTFARKPAPIQASWLGYLGTTGLQAMDYYLCDRFWIPPGELDWQFTEKPAYLPAAVVFQPNKLSPAVNQLPAINNSHITFGSFNRHNKINNSVIVLWSLLLNSTPNARMVLGAIPPEHQEELIKSFEHEGIHRDRLTFFSRTSQTDYLALHHQVDFCLDTFPHGGGATTAHAAWMGVPTLSLSGESPASRFGATEMHHLGLDKFIATNIEDFVDKGRYWAEHIAELASIRQGLRVRFNESALGKPELFASNFEALLRTMWLRWCNDLPTAIIGLETEFESNCKVEPTNDDEPTEQELETLAQLYNQIRFTEAESLARLLTARFPAHGFAWKILGSVLHSLGQLEESLSVHKKVVSLRPDDHEAHFNLACELQQQGHLDEAVKSYISALGLQPNNPTAYINLGNIFKMMGLLPEAEAYCRQAISLDPEMEKAHNNLGNALHAQGKYIQAQASYRLALALKPDWAEAYNNLAITLKDQGYWVEAKDCYHKALSIKPEWSAAHSNLLYCLSHDVLLEPRQLHAEHLAFGVNFETPLLADWQLHSNVKDARRCLQIGFVSGDLYDHALANFLEPAFKFLAEKPNLTLHVYYTHILEDSVTQRMRSYFAHWHAIANLSDADLATQIRTDGIDILIDLSGHTAHNRLLTFARKPAPIQVSWLGYLGTTGLQAMDYYLCDSFWVPPGELDWQFSEKPAYLPTAVVFQPSELAPPVNTLPALENGYITFGSFNRPNKLNESVIVLWSMLLSNVPKARMVLGGIPPDSENVFIQYFANEGIERSRLIFYPRSNLPDYLALHHQVDFCLDTFPYGGGATTSHAAWMGVPTLSLAGESPPSRFGATVMHHLGLDGFVATNIEDFVDKGCYWASHISELASIRQGLRGRFNESALGKPELFASNLEVILRTMWKHWCNNLPPTRIGLEADLESDGKIEPIKDDGPTEQELESLSKLYEQECFPEAETLGRLLVARFPEHGFIWKMLGSALQAQERYADSLQPMKRAIALLPEDAVTHNNLGMALLVLGRLTEAETNFRKAIAIAPDYGKALVNLGTLLRLQGKLEESESCCRRALEIDPCDASAHIYLGNALEDQGKLSEAQACYYRADMAHEPRRAVAHSNLLYLLNHDVLVEPEHLFTEHLAFGEQFEAPLRAAWQGYNNVKDPDRRLQVGFVSGDLCDHALANFLEPAFKFLAKKPNLALHVYSTRTLEDSVTQRMRGYFAHWHAAANLGDVELATQIRADGIDILIDLAGHTAHNRLQTFARKPAPIQASWLGYLGTTGLQAMDYYLCDKFWIPPGELDWQFSEKPAYLPTAVVFQPSELAPPVNTLPALENGYITFGSFNRHSKINASVIALWSMLLRSIPSSHLLLGAVENDAQDVLLQSFAVENITANRLKFCPRVGTADYLALHQQVDICLDPFPHAGGATTANAAWMGVPTLGLEGQTPASRFSGTLMHQLGLDDFVAGSIEEFVHIGRYWAEHVGELAELRASMRERFAASMLGRPEEFVTAFESMLRTMWRGWCDGAAVQSIAIKEKENVNINHAARVEPILPVPPAVMVVSASKLPEVAFWEQSALGLSLNRLVQQGEKISVDIAFENARGLPEIFNAAIERAQDGDILVFVHDDVWIDEYNFSQTVAAGLEQFDVIGVAGNRRRLPNQPAWCFVDQKFTWDDKSHLSGRVSHGTHAFGQISDFGEVPAACELLDGVFLAARKSTLTGRKLQFDPLFDFHFYDLDFCRTARESGLTLGTWAIHLTHQSGGGFGSPDWQSNFLRYQKKSDGTPLPMKQTPLHDRYNLDLFKIIPTGLKKIVEVGCSSGALAKAYLENNRDCEYIGIEIDSEYAAVAREFCNKVLIENIEAVSDEEFTNLCTADAWIFGDALEHLYDPWNVLRRIKKSAPPGTLILSCIPNAQHWSLIANLALGTFRYQDSGLLDRTHIRWFTRLTMIELFESTGFKIVEGFPRIFDEPGRDLVLPQIGSLVRSLGGDADGAMQNSMPLQYIIKAISSNQT